MPALTEKQYVFRYLNMVAGFCEDCTYPMRYEVLDDGRVSIAKTHLLAEHVQYYPNVGPLVLRAESFSSGL